MAYFELQSHPKKSVERGRSAMLLLDSLIRLFSLTTLDADIKRAYTANRPTMVYQNAVAVGYTSSADALTSTIDIPGPDTIDIFSGISDVFVPRPSLPLNLTAPVSSLVPDNMTLGPSTTPPVGGCNCNSLTLEKSWPGVSVIAPSWAGTLIWPENLSDGEFKKEECRRLVWASVMVTASLNSYDTTNDIVDDIQKNQLWIKNPENASTASSSSACAHC